MHPLESRVRRLLWHVKADEWERERSLITLVAREAGPWPIVLSPDLLIDLGRRAGQVDYDHRVLVRLAKENRVLQRWPGPGRQADVWRLVLDVRKWRHVPWLTPRGDVLRDSSVELTGVAVELTVKTPGQAWSWALLEGGPAAPPRRSTWGLSPSEQRSTVIPNRSTPRIEREAGTSATVNSTEADAPTPLTYLSENHSLPDPPSDSGEGVSEGRSPQEVRELTWRMKEHLDPALAVKAKELGLVPPTLEVGSTMWRRAWDVAAKYEGDPAILLARCDSFAGRFSLQRALDELEMWVAAGAVPAGAAVQGAKLERRAVSLRNQLSTWRPLLDPDDPKIQELEDKLAEIQEQLGVTADG